MSQLASELISAYVDLLAVVMPVVLGLGAANMAVNMISAAFFHGSLTVGGGKRV